MSAGTVAFIGSPADARGFRLVGVTAVAPTRDAIERAAAGWLSSNQRRPALVIVSPEAFALAAERLTILEADPEGPIVLILPEDDSAYGPDQQHTPIGGGRTMRPSAAG